MAKCLTCSNPESDKIKDSGFCDEHFPVNHLVGGIKYVCAHRMLRWDWVETAKALRDEFGIDHPGVLVVAGALEDSDLTKVAEEAILSWNAQ